MVYGNLGLLNGKRATCYPGFEKFLTGATYTATKVECDGQFITGKGPGATFDFAYAIVELFCGVDTAEALREGMMYK
jgi:4-methyl-5(b-hydroxyethyl)-thiazole monophosphate biosynthesis